MGTPPPRFSQLPPSPAGSARLQRVRRVPARFGEWEMEPELVSLGSVSPRHVRHSGERRVGSGVPGRGNSDNSDNLPSLAHSENESSDSEDEEDLESRRRRTRESRMLSVVVEGEAGRRQGQAGGGLEGAGGHEGGGVLVEGDREEDQHVSLPQDGESHHQVAEDDPPPDQFDSDGEDDLDNPVRGRYVRALVDLDQQGGAGHQHQVLQGGVDGAEEEEHNGLPVDPFQEELYDQQDGADPQVAAPGGGLGHRGSGRVGVRRSVRVVPPSAQIPQVQPALVQQ